MESNSLKIEVPAKPMLSATRSVDEGFESDPDRISTDSEVQLGSKQQFDILQRTDRDGVTHTQITRRRLQTENSATPVSLPVTSSSQSATSAVSASNGNAAQISLICVSGESDHSMGIGATEQSNCATSAGEGPPLKPERTRRSKTKAPAPPTNPRSHSVDTIRFATNGGELAVHEIDTESINGDVLSGKFVRVQVDPNQVYYPTTQRMHKFASNSLYSIYPNSGSSSLQLWPASSSNFAKLSSTKTKQYQQLQQYHHPSFRPSNGCNAITSRHHINRISHPVPMCWTQSIPRQTRR